VFSVLPKVLPASRNSQGEIGCGKTARRSWTQDTPGEDSKIVEDGKLQLKTPKYPCLYLE
jgi:hypothetical protein